MSQKIAIQGQQASYHDQATRQFFGDDIELVPCNTFKEAFRSLAKKQSDYAVVAIENSLYGSINDVYNLLLQKNFWISGEIYLRVKHCLIGLPNAKLATIKEVHSQAPALAQCEEWLDTHVPLAEHIEEHDTAASVAMIKAWDDPTKAAIASKAAADLYGLKVLAQDIETHPENYTRFVVLQRDKTQVADANKTSLVMETANKPSSLYQALGTFAKRGLNLSKLQSRPIVGDWWHYMFYVDVGAGEQTPAFQDALKELKGQACDITLLGSYRDDRGPT